MPYRGLEPVSTSCNITHCGRNPGTGRWSSPKQHASPKNTKLSNRTDPEVAALSLERRASSATIATSSPVRSSREVRDATKNYTSAYINYAPVPVHGRKPKTPGEPDGPRCTVATRREFRGEKRMGEKSRERIDRQRIEHGCWRAGPEIESGPQTVPFNLPSVMVQLA